MTLNVEAKLREARASDAMALAKLIDIAGEGIPSWLWQRAVKENQSPLEIGVERAQRKVGGFSFTNAVVAELNNQVCGMVLGYPIDRVENEMPADLPAPLVPFLELEMQSANTWYINALAVFSSFRSKGVGAKLMETSEALGRRSGYKQMSIQVYSQNIGAVRLYERLGFCEVARAAVRDHPCQPYYDEDVILLIKSIED